MRGTVLSLMAFLLGCQGLLAAEVEVRPTAKPQQQQSPQPQKPNSAPALPQYRPAVMGLGPNSVINRMNTQELIKNGQKDGSVMFCCSVTQAGEIANVWTYRATPETKLLERELVRCLDQSIFVPGIYNHQPVHVLFYGTVTFAVVNGKPRLRIFANQEAEELKKESDFVGPQPFVGRDSKFEGLHYPDDAVTSVLPGLVELAMKIDADGNLKDLRVVSEEPPLVGFRRAAAEDFRVARFIPAFREGKPVECSITLPVYYEP